MLIHIYNSDLFFKFPQITNSIKLRNNTHHTSFPIKMSKLLILLVTVVACSHAASVEKCTASVTTASGSHAPTSFCSGDIIFQEEFDSLNFKKWQHENTLGGGGVSFVQFVLF